MKGLLPAALLLIFLCPGALAATAPPDPMRFWPEAIDGPDELGGPGRHAFNIIQSGIFDDLEQVIARAGTLQKRYVDGRSLLEAVQRGLYDGYLHYEGPVDAGLMGRVTEWRMKSPQSVAAPIVESIALTAHAWKVRSNTYARDVAPEAWESFQGSLARAEKILVDSKPRSSSNPLWYSQYLYIARGLGWDRAKYLALYDEAIARFPNYEVLRQQSVTTLSPKWGGTLAGVRDFIRKSSASAPAGDQDLIYTYLYQQLLQDAFPTGADFIKASGVDWPRMRKGFLDRTGRYPASFWLLNQFAAYACLAGDRATYAEVRGKIGSHLFQEAWIDRFPADACDRRFGVTTASTEPAAPKISPFRGMQRPNPMQGPEGMTWMGLSFIDKFETRHFAELEAALAKAASLNDRLEDGRTVLEAAEFGFLAWVSDAQQVRAYLDYLAQWHRQDPHSLAAPIIEAIVWRNSAALVSEDGLPPRLRSAQSIYRERIEQAQNLLVSSRAGSAVNPLWYEQMLVVARSLHWPAAKQRTLYAEAMTRFPGYAPLHREAMLALTPKWGGSYAKADQFINEAVGHLHGDDARGLYATLYSIIDAQADAGFELFRQTPASWSRMKGSFEDLAARYPHSPWNQNLYASFACAAGDAAAYQAMRHTIGRMVYRMAWRENRSPEICDQRLSGGAPPMH